MTAMTDEKRVSDRLYVFAKILANNEWTAALLGAYNPDGSTEVPYEAAKAALVADLTSLARRSQEPDGLQLVPVEPTEARPVAWISDYAFQALQNGILIDAVLRPSKEDDFPHPLYTAPSPKEGK